MEIAISSPADIPKVFRFSEILCRTYGVPLSVLESSRAQSDPFVVKGVPLDISRSFEVPFGKTIALSSFIS